MRILAWASGWSRAVKAAGTPASPTRPVTRWAAVSRVPSARAWRVSRNGESKVEFLVHRERGADRVGPHADADDHDAGMQGRGGQNPVEHARRSDALEHHGAAGPGRAGLVQRAPGGPPGQRQPGQALAGGAMADARLADRRLLRRLARLARSNGRRSGDVLHEPVPRELRAPGLLHARPTRRSTGPRPRHLVALPRRSTSGRCRTGELANRNGFAGLRTRTDRGHPGLGGGRAKCP